MGRTRACGSWTSDTVALARRARWRWRMRCATTRRCTRCAWPARARGLRAGARCWRRCPTPPGCSCSRWRAPLSCCQARFTHNCSFFYVSSISHGIARRHLRRAAAARSERRVSVSGNVSCQLRCLTRTLCCVVLPHSAGLPMVAWYHSPMRRTWQATHSPGNARSACE